MTRGYTVDEVKPKLLTLDTVRNRLSETELFGEVILPVNKDISFDFGDSWNKDIDALSDTDVIEDVSVTVKGKEFWLTKAALHDALKLFGMSKGLAEKSPAFLMRKTLNYWFQEGKSGKEFKLLTLNGDTAAAMMRGTIQPYSNMRILDNVLDAIEARYGTRDILADYKFTHSFKGTHLRLIIPERMRVITNSGTENDTWSIGIQLVNSLTGAEQTSMEAYAFRYFCTNGQIDKHSSEAWSRRTKGHTPEDVYDWARKEVDGVLGGMERFLDDVQALTTVNLEGDVGTVLPGYLKRFNIPGKYLTDIMNNMLEAEQQTMYSLMQAFTQVANDTNLDAAHIQHLMIAGGELAHGAHDACDKGFIH